MIELDTIYNEDCLEGMKRIPDGSVDAIICDLPYGTMKGAQIEGWVKAERDTSWDEVIPTEPLFAEYERVLRRGGVCILFSQEPYTTHLRSFHAKNIDFLYPMIWKKNVHANALLAKKAPLSYFEDINVFAKRNPTYDYDGIHPLRPYFAKVMDYIGLPKKRIIDAIGQGADHCFRCDTTQWSLCTAETYQALIDIYDIDMMEGYRTYEDLQSENSGFFIEKEDNRTFNLPEGQSMMSNVLDFAKDTDGFHPTQKPVALIRRLVLTYTNEGDTVLDNCMGSGTTAIACIKEKRHFIGFELSKEYFDKAQRRIKAEQAQLTLF